MSRDKEFSLECPVPIEPKGYIQLAHGGGGRLTQKLFSQLIWREFPGVLPGEHHDSAVVSLGGARLAITTDSYVVRPRFFPGGDIGKLAVCGAVNDLAMSGAVPYFLSLGLVVEEGFSISELETILRSIRETADAAGVLVVTGDTKVLDKGKGDGLFINTSGVGLVPEGVDLRPKRVQPGDLVLVSGDIGRHGVAVLSVREGLQFETPIESDCAPLHRLVESLIEQKIELHCLRDATRGGVAAVVHEIATDAGVSIELEEQKVPVSEPVRGVCELLGLDPLFIANEGRFVAFIPEQEAHRVLACLQATPLGANAAIIGRVHPKGNHPVTIKNHFGSARILDLPSGEQLPRIC